MKIRSGFISNSSSSSYLILGIKLSLETYARMIGGSNKLMEDASLFREDAILEVRSNLKKRTSKLQYKGSPVKVVGEPYQSLRYVVGVEDENMVENGPSVEDYKEGLSKLLSGAFDTNISPNIITWHEITYHT